MPSLALVLYLCFCICLIVFHIFLVVVCVCMPSDGIGRTFIDRAGEEIDSRLDGDGHQTVDCHHRPRQDHRLDRDGHQSYRGIGNRTATKFTQLNNERRSYKMTANHVEQAEKTLLGKTFRSLVVNASKSVEMLCLKWSRIFQYL